MRAAQTIAIFVALILLLTWLSLRAFDPQAELFDRALVELDRFATIENALYRDVFTARAGTLRNYDPLVMEINALRDRSTAWAPRPRSMRRRMRPSTGWPHRSIARKN